MTKNKVKNKNVGLQSPFRESQLITASRFVSYCEDNGVATSKEEFEQLYKEGLFYPAVKVYKGICKFKKIYAKFDNSLEWRYVYPEDVKKFKPKKIDPKNYYDSGGFHSGYDGWLDYYRKNKMIKYPASQKFEAWNKKQYLGFITKYKLIEKDYEFFYDKAQILNLKVILREKKFWSSLKEKERLGFVKKTKQFLVKINDFLEIYFAIENFFEKINKLQQKSFELYTSQGMNTEQIKDQLKEDFKLDILPTLKKAARDILTEYSFDIKYLDYWRNFLSYQCVFSESKRSVKCIGIYLRSVNENDLIQAEDTNRMIYVINQFLFLLTKESKTVKQVLENSQFPRCTVCGNIFMPKKYNQKTCGTGECIRENKNRLKRKKK